MQTHCIDMIRNPILPGFNPDPSIVRVGEDYYIATSTFEWFPGVQIHHSRDLAHWELIARPLDRISQLNMLGNPDSGGVWAPCLSFSGGLFYLIYTDVKQWTGTRHKITHNYLVTAPSIHGPWSDPIYLDSSGFDASLFHDDDGRKWYLSMIWDHRVGRNQFAGTLLQEFDPVAQKLIGPRRNIFLGTELGLTEGPHLYRRDGWYYLLVAEGGTGYEHAATIARSRAIEGPYELDPENPFLTSRHAPDAVLQKAGHASLVQTPAEEWYVVHLCGRPLTGRRCLLGRETAIQKLRWTGDGWPRLAHGGSAPSEFVEAPCGSFDGAEAPPPPNRSRRVAFDGAMDLHFQTLRQPIDASWASFSARPGWLRLRGGEPTTSLFRQSLVARRIQSLETETTTCVEVVPGDFKHMAGLIAFYDTRKHYYLRVSQDESFGRHLAIIRYDVANLGEMPGTEMPLPALGPIFLRATIRRAELQFSYALDNENWVTVGPVLDSSILSDEYDHLGFTGAFIGICVQDLSGQRRHADFSWFDYREL